MITRTHAIAIARKLQARREPRAGHELAVIRHNGVKIAWFAIRKGSRNDQGHDHLPGNLHVTDNDCLRLGACTMSQQDWLDHLQAKGVI